jgi:hypothetical protein
MAELFAVAGIAVTLPGLLSGSWTVLKAAYDLYGQVDTRRTRIGILLDRCRDLIQKLARYLSETKIELSPMQQQGVSDLEE